MRGCNDAEHLSVCERRVHSEGPGRDEFDDAKRGWGRLLWGSMARFRAGWDYSMRIYTSLSESLD
jgi:hypothetical protein